MSSDETAAAALTICESLLLALVDNKTLTTQDVSDLLTDAVEAHKGIAREVSAPDDAQRHRNVARLIERIRNQENSVRLWPGSGPGSG